MDFSFLSMLNWTTLSHVLVIAVFLVFIIKNSESAVRIVKAFIKQPPPPPSPGGEADHVYKAKALLMIKQFIKAATSPAIWIDTDHQILFINDAFEDAFGYAETELVGLDLSVMLPDRYKTLHKHFVKDYIDRLSHGTTFRNVNRNHVIDVVTKNGEVRCTATVTFVQNGVSGFFGILEPVKYPE